MELLIGVMDSVNCETTHNDEIEWIERGLQRPSLSYFDSERTDVRFFTPSVFEIQNFIYEFITSKVIDFLRCYKFIGYSRKILPKG